MARESWLIRPDLTDEHMADLGRRCLYCFKNLRTVGICIGGRIVI